MLIMFSTLSYPDFRDLYILARHLYIDLYL